MQLLDDFLQPSAALPALLAGALVALALLVILRLLRALTALRGLKSAYLLGTATLSAGVMLQQAAVRSGRPLDPTLQHTMLAVLMFCWGYVGLGLLESMLLERWTARNSMAVPRLIRDIARGIAFAIAILIALQLVFNIAPSSIVISSTVLSAVLGLALQDLLKNVIAGVALQLERPFDIGHWIQVDDNIGRVVEMSWRATRVVTVDGNYIIYPNATLAQSNLVNYTLPEVKQALHTQIALSYVHPPNLIKQTLLDAMLASPDVAAEPAPSVKVVSYGEYGITYDLKFWLFSFERYPEKRDVVMTNAWYALQRAGVRMPLPVREVFARDADSAALEQQQRARIGHVQHDLRQVAVLSVLSDDELAALAERVSVRLYGRGDVLVRQGESGSALYILRSGEVRVDVRRPDGTRLTVNHLSEGDFFGEMALMLGTPRGATVVAERDSEVLVVAKADIAPVLRANPELPEQLGAVLAERQRMNEAALAHSHSGAPAPDELLSRPTLAARIRQFFGIE
jgi:small-conductance mechanosensitive channel/CRP-like cAMP-binding protein